MSRPAPTIANSGYLPSLDGLRAVACGLVVVAHAGYDHIVPGGLGVTIFFFLSGYLITTLFYRELRSPESSATGLGIDLPAFYLRRILRLSPPLLASLALCYGLLSLGLARGAWDIRQVSSQVFYYANYYQLYGGLSHTGVAGQQVLWSLSVEEHFYLAYPLFFIFLISRRTVVIRLGYLVGLLICNLLWRLLLAGPLGASSDHLYYATDARLDSIMFGCLLAVLSQEGLVGRFLPSTAQAGAIAQLVGFGLLIVTLIYRDTLFRDTFRYSIQGIALMPIFHYAVLRPQWPHHRVLNLGFMRSLGVFSYSIYLVHHVFFLALRDLAGVHHRPLLLLVGGGLSIGCAWLAFRLIDLPMQRVRQRFHRRRTRDSGAYIP